MSMKRYVLLPLVLACTAKAQVYEPTYDKVLIPVPPGVTSGAFGSQWTAAVAVSNISATPVDVQGHGDCRTGAPCRPLPIPPNTTVYINQLLRSNVPAAFINVEPGRINDLSITMRVFDQSRQTLTWGASLPVVTEEELFRKPFGIGDINVTDAFRSTLRIFDFDATTLGAVRIKVYEVFPSAANEVMPGPPDQLLATLTPVFATPVEGGGTIGHPGYASVPLWLLPELAEAQYVRVVIEPLDDTGEYWAMVSSTHNETQHVTVLAPR